MATLKQMMDYAKNNPNDPRNAKLKEFIVSGAYDDRARQEGIDLTGKSKTFTNEVQEQPSFLERASNAVVNAIPLAGPAINELRNTNSVEDIKQTGLNVVDTLKQSGTDFQDIANREQAPSSTVLQGAGQALGTGSKLFGDVFTGALKAVSTPEQEEFATKLFSKVLSSSEEFSKNAPQPLKDLSGNILGGVDFLTEEYETMKTEDPEKAANVRAKLQIVEALTELFGTKGVSQVAGQADEVIEQAIKQADKLIANPSSATPEVIEAITKNIEDTQTQFAKVREVQPEIKQADEALKSSDTGITTENANIGQKLVAGDSLLTPRDKKRLLKVDTELGNKYIDVLEKSELDDTAPPLFEVATNDVSDVFTEFENFNKATGSKIGKIKQKINATPVNKPRVQEVINELDSILASKGLTKTDDGLYVVREGSNSPFGEIDVKNINKEIVGVLENIKNAQTNEQLILGMESLENKIKRNLDTKISTSLQGLSKKVDGQLRDIRNTLMSPEELVQFEKYSKAIDFINEFKKSDNKIKTLINREDSMRSGDLQKIAKTLEEVTGKDIRDNTRLMKILIDASPQGGTNRSLLNQRITEGAGIGAELVTGRPLGALQEILKLGGKKIFDVDKLKEIKKAIDTNIKDFKQTIKDTPNKQGGFVAKNSKKSTIGKYTPELEDTIRKNLLDGMEVDKKGNWVKNPDQKAVIIDSDTIKKAHPDFDPDNPQLLHDDSSKLSKQIYRDAIDADTSGKVKFSAGSAGSGKSEVIINGIKKEPSVIFDGVMGGEKSAIDKIEYALSKGKYVEIHSVYTPPELAYLFNRMRSRTVPDAPFMDTVKGHRQNMVKLYNKYGDKIDWKIYNNDRFNVAGREITNEIDTGNFMKFREKDADIVEGSVEKMSKLIDKNGIVWAQKNINRLLEK